MNEYSLAKVQEIIFALLRQTDAIHYIHCLNEFNKLSALFNRV